MTPDTASNKARGAGGPPDLAAMLGRIEERLARMEKAVEGLTPPGTTPAGALATAVDTMDDLARRAQDRGIDIDARMAGVVRLVERLTDPRTERALERMLAAAPLLEKVVDLAESAPGLVAAAMDTADSLVERAGLAGIDVEDRLRTMTRVLERLTSPEALAAVETMLDRLDAVKAVLASGVLDPAALATVATAGDALAKAASSQSAPMGLWAAFRASGDPEVQRALGFLVRFAHAFGADLQGAPKQLVEAKIR
ncbi:MAG: DUF1641 domain-containing protein [Polyangiaceae bacterium]|nr:DUF1641 domain-containing protein [Polyangiaceae bacterium]